MTHFAKLDENNIVIAVLVGRDEDDGKENELSQRTGDVYKQTSYNTSGNVHYDPITRQPDGKPPFRGNYAGIGYIYDPVNDVFYAPQPYPSWTLDTATWIWVPPVPRPEGLTWEWDETSQSWVEMVS